jgi:hypothetical protein
MLGWGDPECPYCEGCGFGYDDFGQVDCYCVRRRAELAAERRMKQDVALRALIARDWAVAVRLLASCHEVIPPPWEKVPPSNQGWHWSALRLGDLPAPADVVAELFGD